MGYSIFVAFCVVVVFLACTAGVSVFLAYGSSQLPNEPGAPAFKPSVYQPMPMLTRRPPAPEGATATVPPQSSIAA